MKQAWTFSRELDREAIACHGKGEGVVWGKAPLNNETLLGQCNAMFEALSVVLRSDVGDHRALGTWHASRIMLMIPDTYSRSFSSSWDNEFLRQRKFIQGYATV